MKILSLSCVNYRTLETLSLDFDHSFAAICGPNDSGKTNVIRAIRTLMQEGSGRFYDDNPELNVKDDFPKWNSAGADSKSVSLSATFQIFEDKDAGLFQAIVKQLTLETSENSIIVTVQIKNVTGKSGNDVSVTVGEKIFTNLESQQVLKLIQSGKCVVFHNSTQLSRDYIFHDSGVGINMMRDLSIEDARVINSMKSTVNKSMAKIAKGRQKEFEELLGKLEHHYKVGLSMPSFDFTHLPLSITLGEAKFEVPLDEWGSGTKNRTQILLALFMARKISESEVSAKKITPIIIIEEPECFLHPSAQAEFGRVIRDLAHEFQVQVILTTHSPYMLSLTRPESNILLKRKLVRKQYRETNRVDTAGENWMQPFAEALGLETNEFEPWKKLYMGRGKSILLVEGEIDRDYFELLRDKDHGTRRLDFDGEIIPYDGAAALENQTLLRFIKNRYSKIFVTFDLDAESRVARNLERMGYQHGVNFLPLGKNLPGKKDIEGLLPDKIKATVRQRESDLVDAASGATGDEQKSARNRLKRMYLEEFKKLCKPNDEFFGAFYPIVKTINQALK